MSDAQVVDPVKQHFVDGKLTRLDVTMLPRDTGRVLGTLRAVLCKSFNYCRQYPAKLEVFINVVEFATRYAKFYQAYDNQRREEAKQKNTSVDYDADGKKVGGE